MPQVGAATKPWQLSWLSAIRPTMKLASALLLAIAAPVPASAVEPAAGALQAELSPHERILVAMESGVDVEQQLSGVIDTMAEQLVTASPELTELESRVPGLSRAAAEAMRPIFRRYSARVRELYRPRLIAVFAEIFTPAEAVDVAEFYASPIGRKLTGGVSEAFDGDEMVAAAIKGGDIPDTAIISDTRRAARRAVARLSQEELAALGELAQARLALRKLSALSARLRPLQIEMQNAPMLPDEEKSLERAITTAMDKHVARGAKGT